MRPGLNHIAFTMPDLETAAEEVKATGIEPLDQDFYDPDTGRTFYTPDPCYDKRSGRTIFSFNDPSGVGLQFAREDGRGEYKDFK